MMMVDLQTTPPGDGGEIKRGTCGFLLALVRGPYHKRCNSLIDVQCKWYLRPLGTTVDC